MHVAERHGPPVDLARLIASACSIAGACKGRSTVTRVFYFSLPQGMDQP